MIETFSEYKLKRYSPLELEFLDATKKSLNDNLPSVKKYLLSEWSKAIADACEVQRDEKIPCAYVSVSLLNTSLIDDKPALQIDFYDEQWIYGESFSRGRLNADFLFTHWKNFTAQALDEKFFVRRYISRTEIKSLFWGTLDKLTFLFACFVKYFAADLRNYRAFDELVKAEKFYVTCGTYLDWQNRVHAVLPEIDFVNPDDNEDTTFREAHGKIFRLKTFADLNLRACRFEDCLFHLCTFANLNLADAYFSRCRFVSANFVDLKLAGAEFSECTFKDCEFKNSTADSKAVDADEYFAPLKTNQCKFFNLQIEGCDFDL